MMKKFEYMLTRFDRIHERDRHPHGQTDRQTPHDGIGRAGAQHFAEKTNKQTNGQTKRRASPSRKNPALATAA